MLISFLGLKWGAGDGTPVRLNILNCKLVKVHSGSIFRFSPDVSVGLSLDVWVRPSMNMSSVGVKFVSLL